MARKKLRYLLFDFPGDHEVDRSMSTECETVHALLINRGLGSRAKLLKFSSKESLCKLSPYQYDPKFVHISCHASRKSVGLLGSSVTWKYLATEILKPRLKPLANGETRILFLSCCKSSSAKGSIKRHIPGYFTGIYYFKPKFVLFADSLTVAGMFYRKKHLKNPHAALVKGINTFFGEKLIAYVGLGARGHL